MDNRIVNYEKKYNLYCSLMKQMRKIIKHNILACFRKAGVREFEFNTDIVDPFCICYDGGSHPELASNVFSEVRCIRLEDDGDICVETEDGHMWFNWMPFNDIVEVERNLVENLDAIMEDMGLTKTKEEN